MENNLNNLPSPNTVRIGLAKWLGYSLKQEEDGEFVLRSPTGEVLRSRFIHSPEEYAWSYMLDALPYFTGSLDAVAQARRHLRAGQRSRFMKRLAELVPDTDFALVDAEAHLQATAIFRTIDGWVLDSHGVPHMGAEAWRRALQMNLPNFKTWWVSGGADTLPAFQAYSDPRIVQMSPEEFFSREMTAFHTYVQKFHPELLQDKS